MKKLIASLTIILLFIGVPSASASTKIVVSSQYKVSKKTKTITFKVYGLPATNGIYVSQCMAPEVVGAAPTACNPSEKSKVWISNLPADQKQGATPGANKITLKVDTYFAKGDCIHTTCVLFAMNDHNASQDRSEDQAIPFKFGGSKLF